MAILRSQTFWWSFVDAFEIGETAFLIFLQKFPRLFLVIFLTWYWSWIFITKSEHIGLTLEPRKRLGLIPIPPTSKLSWKKTKWDSILKTALLQWVDTLAVNHSEEVSLVCTLDFMSAKGLLCKLITDSSGFRCYACYIPWQLSNSLKKEKKSSCSKIICGCA